MPRTTVSRRSAPSPRKRYSQNFLTDAKVAAAVVKMAEVTREELIWEIGPGAGMLTRAISKKSGQLVTYEIDSQLSDKLQNRYSQDPRVRCLNRDFLSVSPPSQPFKVVANIPYGRTNAITQWCLRAKTLRSATLMTQWEYARKRTGDYGRWSQVTIESWPLFEWRLLGRIDRNKFYPAPRVDSAIMQLRRRQTPLLRPHQMGEFRKFVALGFSGVGGSFSASVRHGYGSAQARKALRASRLYPTTPVGFVTPTQWLEVFQRLSR